MSSGKTVAHGMACAFLVMFLSIPALAQDSVSLFKVITVKDEIVIGLSEKDLGALGGEDAGFVGRALAANGELTAWQFAVRKAEDGELEQAPHHVVSILAHESLRIEPYATPLRVVPLQP